MDLEPKNSESLPEETLAIASAIVERGRKESERERDLAGDVLPQSPAWPIEIAQSMRMGATVLMIQLIEDPESTLNPLAIGDALVSDATLETVLATSTDTPTAVDIQRARLEINAAVTAVWEEFSLDEKEINKFAQSLQVAKEIAKAHSVEVSEVFADEELYRELKRTLHTSDEYVTEAVSYAERMNMDLFISTTMNATKGMLEEAGFNAEQVQEETMKITWQIYTDPSLRLEVEQHLARSVAAFKQKISGDIQRFWGEEALQNLSEANKELLASVPDFADKLPLHLKELQQRKYIISVLCEQLDWDPENLTIKQTGDINKMIRQVLEADEDI